MLGSLRKNQVKNLTIHQVNSDNYSLFSLEKMFFIIIWIFLEKYMKKEGYFLHKKWYLCIIIVWIFMCN